MAAITEMCRLSIRSAHTDAELALPAHLPLRELLPALVDVMGEDLCAQDVGLTRPDGTVLDSARSLAQCGVQDGDVLLLTPTDEQTPRPGFDVCRAVAQAVERADHGARVPQSKAAMPGVLWSAITVALLICVEARAGGGRQVGAGFVAASAALVAAFALRRQHGLSITLGLLATALAGLTALLAEPDLSGFLLAMSAVSATSLVVWRVLCCGAEVFLPLAGASMSSAAASAAAVAGGLPAGAVGPLLVTVALAVLAASPRLATRFAGLSPSAWPDDGVQARALRGHRLLTTLVVTTAATTALGTILTAVFTVRPMEAAGFIGAVVATLLSRSRTHDQRWGASALSVSAGVAATVFVVRVAITAPWTIGWLCALSITTAGVAVLLASAAISLSPVAHRVIAAIDVAASAAVVPSACAAAGLFAAIRGLL